MLEFLKPRSGRSERPDRQFDWLRLSIEGLLPRNRSQSTLCLQFIS